MLKRKDEVEVIDPAEAMRRTEELGRRVLAVPKRETESLGKIAKKKVKRR
jgi:hypothetical protein